MDLARYTALFLTESREHISVINRQLLELERTPGAAEPVAALFRAVHTIKGMSATMGYAGVAALAHEWETLLDGMRGGRVVATPSVLEACFAAADAMEAAVERSATGENADAALAPALERLRGAAGESAGGADRAASAAPDAGGEEDGPDSVRGAFEGRRGSASRSVRIELGRLDALMNLMGELVIARGRLAAVSGPLGVPALDDVVGQVVRLVSELQEQVLFARMVPVGQVFDRFPRLVRDAARGVNKRVDFTIEGAGIELDRSMLDEIGEPVMHLLRNAVDHGVETPEARLAAGKPAAGRITLVAERDRAAVVIRVMDDGRGIDRERVLARARAEGLVDAGVAALTDAELVRLVARAGFSTAERVSDLSGRGVGIDVVHARVRALGGSVEIRTASGRGTTVTLRLPLTLAIVRALLARVGSEIYALPLTHIAETVELAPEAVRQVTGREMLVLRDDVMPLIRFRDRVGLAPVEGGSPQAVVLEAGSRRAGLVVDELTGQQDIVVKQFEAARASAALFSGATILPDGAPALIIDVGSLL